MARDWGTGSFSDNNVIIVAVQESFKYLFKNTKKFMLLYIF